MENSTSQTIRKRISNLGEGALFTINNFESVNSDNLVSRSEKQLIRVPRGKHSEKPMEVLYAIERMFPTQERIELFARHKPAHWDVWGLDVREEFGDIQNDDNLKKVVSI